MHVLHTLGLGEGDCLLPLETTDTEINVCSKSSGLEVRQAQVMMLKSLLRLCSIE